MKKSIAIISVFCFAILVKTNTGGPGWGYTNAPVTSSTTESNCTGCHSSYSLQTSGSNFNRISLNNNLTGNGYIPDSTYTFVLGYKETGKSKFGFQLTCLDEKTYKAAGTFTNADSRSQTGTSVVGGGTRYYLGQTSTGSAAVTTDSTSWRFSWKAPNRNVGNVVFWVTLNVTNSSSGSSGDYIYSKSFTFRPSTLLPTAKAKITDVNICSNNQVNFAADVTGSPTSYSWSFPGGTPANSTSATPKVTYTASGNFFAVLSVRNNKGPSLNDTLRFTVKPAPALPIVSPSSNQNICQGDSLRLSIAPVGGISYKWSPKGQTSTSIFAKDSGLYSVTATASNGCSRTSSPPVKITVNPSPGIDLLSNANGDSICNGSSITLTIKKTKAPADSFSFTSSGGPWNTDTSRLLNVNNAGNNVFNAWVKSSAGCRSQATINIRSVAKLTGPKLQLSNKTLSGFKISWDAVKGANGYRISEDSGKTFKVPSSGSGSLEHIVTGMTAGKKREIQVKALLNALCGESETSVIIGESDTCSPLSFNLSFSQPKICLNSTSTLHINGLKGKNVSVRINGDAAGNDTSIVLKPLKSTMYTVEVLDLSKPECGYYGPKTITLSIDTVPVETNFSGTALYSQCTNNKSFDLKLERIGGNVTDSLFWIQNGLAVSTGFSKTCNYTVKNNDSIWLRVKNNLGCTGEGKKTKIALLSLPNAGFTYQNVGMLYSFSANDTNGLHEWKGPDGLFSSSSKSSLNLTSQAGKSIKIYHRLIRNGCEATDSVLISVQLQSLNSQGRNAWIKVYPNPAYESINIQASSAGFIQITNAEGRLIISETIEKDIKLKLNRISAGVYTVTFKNQNGYSYSRFVILK